MKELTGSFVGTGASDDCTNAEARYNIKGKVPGSEDFWEWNFNYLAMGCCYKFGICRRWNTFWENVSDLYTDLEKFDTSYGPEKGEICR